MAEFAASGLTRREFCERRGVAMGTLDVYRRREARRDSPRLLPVEVVGSGHEPIGMRDGHGRRIEIGPGFDPETLLRLLETLEAR